MTAATPINTEQHQHDTEEIEKNKMERIKLKKANKKSKKAAKDKKKQTQTTIKDTDMTTTKKEEENVDNEKEESNDDDQNAEVSSPPSKDSNGKKTKKSKKTKKKKRSHEKKSKDASSNNNDESTGGDDDADMEDSETTTHLSGKTTESQEDDDEEGNTHSDDFDEERGGGDDGGDERKIFLTRIPTKFDADTITRLFELSFGEGCIEHIALPLTRNEDDEDGDGEGGGVRGRDGKSIGGGGGTKADRGIDKRRRREEDDEEEGEHRGFGFVTMTSISKRDEAIEKGSIRGSLKETSKKKHTLYIRSVVRPDHEDGKETNIDGGGVDDVCYLWSKSRCPYGDTCKFKHVGEGGCVTVDKNTEGRRKKKQKCFKFQSKGGCTLGDKCPYSHDADVITPGGSKKDDVSRIVQEKKDKDCINWKTKGKCRKMDKCPYRHDDAVRDARLAKKRDRTDKTTVTPSSKKRKANPQPLSIRVFGLNYDTKVSDIREYFAHCGFISEVTFPVYEDSGRSKGYCGILFTSPKATEKACELDGKELLGRWLSVQPGKMYLKQWAEREQLRLEGRKNDEPGNEGDEDGNTAAVQNVGEFGQKVKTRKKHGFKE